MARGFSEAAAMFDRLPRDVRSRVGFMLLELSGELSAAQKARLTAQTRGTGHLGRGIEAETMLQQLRMRSGLLALAEGKKSSRFYGIWIEFGRKAQTVLRHRMGKKGRDEWHARIRAGTAKRNKRPEDIGTIKPMQVTAMAPREFIALPDVEARVMRRTADFWAEVLGQ